MEHARPPPELCLEGGPAARAEAWRRWYTQFQVFLKASGVCKETTDVQASLLCEFKDLEESLMRDRIVCGVASSKVRDRLLRAEDLTLDKAVKITQANEMSSEEKREIEESKVAGAPSTSAVDVLYGTSGQFSGGGRGRRPQRWRGRGGRRGGGGGGGATARGAGSPSAAARSCAACGSTYCDGGQRCPATGAKCLLCGGAGHFKVKCPFKRSNKVYQIEEEDGYGDDDELYFIDGVDVDSDYHKDRKKWYETLLVSDNRRAETFKLDTGSDLNVLSMKNFKKLGLDSTSIEPDNIRAESFCGNFVPMIGSCIINWLYKERLYPLRFVICRGDRKSVLGKYACEDLGLVKRIYSLSLDHYEDLFHGLGKLPGEYTISIEEGAQPSVCPVRKIPMGVRDKLQGELERMVKMGVIRKVSHPTPWVNAIVVAAKKDGSIRVCLDPRPLNRVVRRARYPLPALGEIATKLQGARYFSKLDARSGFWMVQIDDASADLCTFGTPFGRYQFLRLPYGINCASEVFHSKVRQILEELEGVESFVDDIIVYGRTLEKHDARLKSLLDRSREVGIKFNKQKCEFRVQQITYLGHTFSHEGMRVDAEKVKAIEKMPSPHDRASLERFLGMVNYLSKFIPNYSEVASPLRALLKKDSEWCWEPEHEAAAGQLRALVSGAPVLALYAPRAPVLVSVDASQHALGAVILQAGRPVEFASATLTDAQTRYAQIEKELLAIVFGLERFHQYVYAHGDVTIETDHKPLEALFSKPLYSVPARLQRMMLRIQGYDFKVVYKPEMIGRVHDGHMGIDRCKRHARDVMFWPGMSRDVERRVRRCGACAARAPRAQREPMLPHDIPDLPWIKPALDLKCIFSDKNNVVGKQHTPRCLLLYVRCQSIHNQEEQIWA
ncbi:uncharacterized protein K02A2.6-like [Cydia splendana]|uniref:uncharacterized protein K02A2.6-like n=1 Tax=Cydia splendana TaxID=1100963 RepID=UPI00300D8B61